MFLFPFPDNSSLSELSPFVTVYPNFFISKGDLLLVLTWTERGPSSMKNLWNNPGKGTWEGDTFPSYLIAFGSKLSSYCGLIIFVRKLIMPQFATGITPKLVSCKKGNFPGHYWESDCLTLSHPQLPLTLLTWSVPIFSNYKVFIFLRFLVYNVNKRS